MMKKLIKIINKIPILREIMQLIETPTGVLGFCAIGLSGLLIKGRNVEIIQDIFNSPNDIIWGFLSVINVILWIAFLYCLYLVALKKSKKERVNKQYQTTTITWALIKVVFVLFIAGAIAYIPTVVNNTFLLVFFGKHSFIKEWLWLIQFTVWGFFMVLIFNFGLELVFKKGVYNKEKKKK